MEAITFDFLERQVMAVVKKDPSEKALIDAMERLGKESPLAAEIARRAELEGIAPALLGVGLFQEDAEASEALARASTQGFRPRMLTAFVEYLTLKKEHTSWAGVIRRRLLASGSYLGLLVAIALVTSVVTSGVGPTLIALFQESELSDPSLPLTWLKFAVLAATGLALVVMLLVVWRGSDARLWRFLSVWPVGRRAVASLEEARSLALMGIDGQTGIDRLTQPIRRQLRAAMTIDTEPHERLYHQKEALQRFQQCSELAAKRWIVLLAIFTVIGIFLTAWDVYYLPVLFMGGF